MKNVICASERTKQPRLQLNSICTSCSTCLRWSLWACAASCDSITFFFETNTLTTDAQDTSPWPPQTPPTCKLKKHIRKIDSFEIAGQYLFQVCSNSPELGATAVCTLTTAAPCFAFLFSTSNAGCFLFVSTACELPMQGDWRIHSLNSFDSQHETSSLKTSLAEAPGLSSTSDLYSHLWSTFCSRLLSYSATQYNSWKCMCCKQKYVRVAQHNVTGSFLSANLMLHDHGKYFSCSQTASALLVRHACRAHFAPK